MNSYLHIKSFLGQEKTIELLGGWSPLSCKGKVKKINNGLRNQSLLSIDQKKELEMTPALEKEGPVASTSSRSVQGQAQRTSEETERSQEPSGQRKRQSKLEQTLPTRVQDPPIGTFSSEKCLQCSQNSYGCHSQEEGKYEQDSSMQIIQEIQFFKTIINVELGKIDTKLTKITFDVNDLKNNDRNSSEWNKSTITKLDTITNTCDRIEILKIIENTNQFATPLAKGDSEKKKLKNEIIANVEKSHKNYEPHIPKHSTPFTEAKLSVKESLTPFLGENVISVRDIPKLEEWPTISGEGEYSPIEFIRTIGIFQEDFHIPDGIIVGKLHSLFTRTAKKRSYKMRQDHCKHDWPWWKSEIITKWANNSWIFKM
ncbi:hypothetical protein O181_026239 [Austropuccinia psidii MF-1]|uniref:Uncharacterized protein n=1 Tax=Austropuccinia psidii MF-1 TaxID=1389203 RepID=A0A9Q3CJL1_9BASI|nr:hypothetical protein [Austropuccinia psidii MF-1]